MKFYVSPSCIKGRLNKNKDPYTLFGVDMNKQRYHRRDPIYDRKFCIVGYCESGIVEYRSFLACINLNLAFNKLNLDGTIIDGLNLFLTAVRANGSSLIDGLSHRSNCLNKCSFRCSCL